MKYLAVTADQLGPPDSFHLATYDVGDPGIGEVRVAIHAAGVSFVDVLIASGGYQLRPTLPYVPGTEFAGVVDAVGPDVRSLRVGDRVCGLLPGGAFAEGVIAPSPLIVGIPSAMTFEEASIFRSSYTTAYYALVQRGGVRTGETLLVLGGGGAVGYAAIEVGVALGARVIASASTSDKRRLALDGGAYAAVDTGSSTWREDVAAANGGHPVDVVFDPVGGPTTESAFRSLGWGGRFLVIGFAAGNIAKLPVNLPLVKGASLIGVDVRRFAEKEPELALANLRALFNLYAEGCLRPRIAHSYPLEAFAEAMRSAGKGETAGRVILTMGDVKSAHDAIP